MQGIMIVDKPAGWTSFDVIAKLRGVLGTRKLGHSGTLDPMATGVLPVFFGGASKAVRSAAGSHQDIPGCAAAGQPHRYRGHHRHSAGKPPCHRRGAAAAGGPAPVHRPADAGAAHVLGGQDSTDSRFISWLVKGWRWSVSPAPSRSFPLHTAAVPHRMNTN